MMIERPKDLTSNKIRQREDLAMAKRIGACLMAIAICLVQGGCWNYESLDQINVVIGVAVDFDKNANEYDVSFEVAELAKAQKESCQS
ncbi:MAG: hypothetical protein ACOX7I_01680 [Oscillospiraceae bacterium]|jgi:hypothetical protein